MAIVSDSPNQEAKLKLLRPRADAKAELWERLAEGWEAIYDRDLIRSTGDEDPDRERRLEVWGAETKQFLRSCFDCAVAAEHPAYLFENAFQSGMNSDFWGTADHAFAPLHALARQVDHLPEPIVTWSKPKATEVAVVRCITRGCGDFQTMPTYVDVSEDDTVQRSFVVHACPRCQSLNVAVVEQQAFDNGKMRKRQVDLWPLPPAFVVNALPAQLETENADAARKLHEATEFYPSKPSLSVKAAAEFLESWLKRGLGASSFTELTNLIKESRDKKFFSFPETAGLMHGIRKAANAHKHGAPESSNDAEAAQLALSAIDLLLSLKYRAPELKARFDSRAESGKPREGPP